jgi:hypothetical protein
MRVVCIILVDGGGVVEEGENIVLPLTLS